MNEKIFQSYLSMSMFIGFFINFILTLILNTQSEKIYNYLITGVCSVIPFILFVIFITFRLYKIGKLNIKKAIIFSFIYLIITFVMGYLFECLIIDKLFNKDINNIVRMVNALYQSTIGILIATNFNYDYYRKIEK